MLPFCRCRRLSLVLEVRGGRSCGALKVSHLPFADRLECCCLDGSWGRVLRLAVLEGSGVENVCRELCRYRVVAESVEVLNVLSLMCSARILVIVSSIRICTTDSPLLSLAGAYRDHTFTHLPFAKRSQEVECSLEGECSLERKRRLAVECGLEVECSPEVECCILKCSFRGVVDVEGHCS